MGNGEVKYFSCGRIMCGQFVSVILYDHPILNIAEIEVLGFQ